MSMKIITVFLAVTLFAGFIHGGMMGIGSGVVSGKVISTDEKAQNVILMIGDGMGIPHITLARWAKSGENLSAYPNTTLALDSFPYSGYSTTYAANSFITDSAPAATALMTGTKTNLNVIGEDATSVYQKKDGTRVETIAELAGDNGLSTGVVTTTRITHATPAGAYAHINDRDDEAKIAEQLISSDLDVALGGGSSFFIPQPEKDSKRKDDKNLIAEASGDRWNFVNTTEALESASDDTKLLGLFTSSHMSYDDQRNKDKEPSLSEMTDKALRSLSKNKNGFFLMVEGGRIDHASHERNVTHGIADTLAFDEAVATAMKFQKEHPDTLLLVTADHECGGLVLGAQDIDTYDAGMMPAFMSGVYQNSTTGYLEEAKEASHTAVDVPVFAIGPGADQVTGAPIDNTDIFRLMKTVLGL